MKNCVIVFLFLFFADLARAQAVEYAQIIYIPFNVHIEGRITPEFLETDTRFREIVVINDPEAINLLAVATSLLNLIPKTSRNEFTPYMAIHLFIKRPEESKFKNPLQKTIYLNAGRQIRFYDTQFHRSEMLDRWLETYVFTNDEP